MTTGERGGVQMTAGERGGAVAFAFAKAMAGSGTRRNGLGKPGPYGFKGKGYGGPSGILVGCLSG